MRGRLVAAAAVLLLGSGCSDASDPTDPDADSRADTPTPRPSVASPSPAPPGVLDGCALVPTELLTTHFGLEPSLVLTQPPALGDPDALDCAWSDTSFGARAEVTARPDRYLPERRFVEFAALPGAEAVPGADRGFVAGSPERGSFVLMVVAGGTGVAFSLTVDRTDLDLEDVQAFAQDLLVEMSERQPV